jgi:hypothetical protein
VLEASEDTSVLSLPRGELTVHIAPLWWKEFDQSFDLMPLLHLRKRAPHLIFTFEYKQGYESTCSFDGSLPHGWAGLSREQFWSMPDICRLLRCIVSHGADGIESMNCALGGCSNGTTDSLHFIATANETYTNSSL